MYDSVLYERAPTSPEMGEFMHLVIFKRLRILKGIFKSYALATIVQSGVSFVAIGILARLLPHAQLGKWVLLEPLVILAANV